MVYIIWQFGWTAKFMEAVNYQTSQYWLKYCMSLLALIFFLSFYFQLHDKLQLKVAIWCQKFALHQTIHILFQCNALKNKIIWIHSGTFISQCGTWITRVRYQAEHCDHRGGLASSLLNIWKSYKLIKSWCFDVAFDEALSVFLPDTNILRGQ